MKTAQYLTEKGARRYAEEIKRVWKDKVTDAYAAPDSSFRYGVRVKLKSGSTVWAGKRPRNFGG